MGLSCENQFCFSAIRFIFRNGIKWLAIWITTVYNSGIGIQQSMKGGNNMESIDQRAERGIKVWAQDEKTELEIGINRSGELFLGNDKSGYNLTDTPENRDYIVRDFKWHTGIEASIPE